MCQMPSWAVSTMRRNWAWLWTSSAPLRSAWAAASLARAAARRRVSLITLMVIPVIAKSSRRREYPAGVIGTTACGLTERR
jgi:hypothetical protein